MIIAFLGPETTFTHQAAIKHFGEKNSFLAKKSISEVFESVEKKGADVGVVPVENSSEGAVAHTLDSFFDSNLRIIAEIVLPIKHCLLSNYAQAEVKKIFSHPQAFAQCRKYLADKLPQAELIDASSTANAALLALKEKNSAAIASKTAADKFGLKVLAEGINDDENNQTRFFAIGASFPKQSGKDKTTMLFSTKNVPGALYNVLGVLAKYKINMTKIESRPSKEKLWGVVFFVDFEGHCADKNVLELLKELENHCQFLKVLGSYPKKASISD